MDDKIQVLDVPINNYTAKEAMAKVVEYMKSEPINIIEVVTINTLMQFVEKEEQKKNIGEFDMILAGNKDILKVAGVEENRQLKEADSMLFVKMVMRFLHKNHNRVFLLADSDEALQEAMAYLRAKYDRIEIVESATVEEHGKSDDMIVNKVNGAETECIISFLSSPGQEEFIVRNRSLLNARIWFALGNKTWKMQNKDSRWRNIRAFLGRRILKKEIEKKRKENENCE